MFTEFVALVGADCAHYAPQAGSIIGPGREEDYARSYDVVTAMSWSEQSRSARRLPLDRRVIMRDESVLTIS